MNFVVLFTFSGIFAKILSILLKFVKLLKNSVVDFNFKDTKYCQLFLYRFFVQSSWLNFSKFILFHQKQHEISFFSPLRLNLPKLHPQIPLIKFLLTQKGAIPSSTLVESALYLKNSIDDYRNLRFFFTNK